MLSVSLDPDGVHAILECLNAQTELRDVRVDAARQSLVEALVLHQGGVAWARLRERLDRALALLEAVVVRGQHASFSGDLTQWARLRDAVLADHDVSDGVISATIRGLRSEVELLRRACQEATGGVDWQGACGRLEAEIVAIHKGLDRLGYAPHPSPAQRLVRGAPDLPLPGIYPDDPSGQYLIASRMALRLLDDPNRPDFLVGLGLYGIAMAHQISLQLVAAHGVSIPSVDVDDCRWNPNCANSILVLAQDFSEDFAQRCYTLRYLATRCRLVRVLSLAGDCPNIESVVIMESNS